MVGDLFYSFYSRIYVDYTMTWLDRSIYDRHMHSQPRIGDYTFRLEKKTKPLQSEQQRRRASHLECRRESIR